MKKDGTDREGTPREQKGTAWEEKEQRERKRKVD